MKKLPNIFKPDINRSINNNKRIYYSFINNEDEIKKEVKKERKIPSRNNGIKILNQLNDNSILNKNVLIKTLDNEEYETIILSKMGNNIIISNGKVLSVFDILSIEII